MPMNTFMCIYKIHTSLRVSHSIWLACLHFYMANASISIAKKKTFIEMLFLFIFWKLLRILWIFKWNDNFYFSWQTDTFVLSKCMKTDETWSVYITAKKKIVLCSNLNKVQNNFCRIGNLFRKFLSLQALKLYSISVREKKTIIKTWFIHLFHLFCVKWCIVICCRRKQLHNTYTY